MSLMLVIIIILDEQFDVLLQEAIHCDQSLRNSRQPLPSKDSNEHLIKVFTRLMLEGKVRVAVCRVVF